MSRSISAQEDRQTPDKKLYVSAGSLLIDVPLYKRHVFVAGDSAPRTSIVLPNVSEAEGYEFIVSATTEGGGGIHIDYSNGGLAALSTTIITTGVELSCYSTGVIWKLVRS